MGEGERADRGRVDRVLRRAQAHAAWLVYTAAALACTFYFMVRTDLVPKWGEWYLASDEPFVLLQVRAMLSGRLAILTSSLGAAHDFNWGRGGMHQAWGLGTPILAMPFHLVGRLFGAPGFPDNVRFLIFYAATTVALAHSLHRVSTRERGSSVTSAAAAGFVMVFPTFVGLVASRFLIFEQTIATGALWDVGLLAGVLALLDRCTLGRLVVLCAAAGFALVIRPPLAVYGVTTVAIALIVARRQRAPARTLAAGLTAFVATSSLYCGGNLLRFGSALNTGYATCVSGTLVNRLTRWNLAFSKAPFFAQAKELFSLLFLLDPVPAQTMTPPPSVVPYIVPAERWREFYAPTFDLIVLAVWATALVLLAVSVVRGRLWRSDRALGGEASTVIGAWAIPPSIVLFVFYSRVPNMVTRYAVDFYPAMVAGALSVGMTIVRSVRRRSPSLVSSTQLALAAGVALYLGAGKGGWATHMAYPAARKEVLEHIAQVDSHAKEQVPEMPRHVSCAGPRGPAPVHTHFEDWHPDCTFTSGTVFAFPYSPCVTFTFAPGGGQWGQGDGESLKGFRANADFDELVSCGAPKEDGHLRRVTMCQPHAPPFLLQGMRLYAIASLDPNLNAIDRLRLMQVDAVSSCEP